MRWTMLCWLALITPALAQDTMTVADRMPPAPLTLIEFRDGDARTAAIDSGASGETLSWMVVNDGVMGGLSDSRIQATNTGTGVFEGTLSLENNGGFASVRALLGQRDLSEWSFMRLRVRGDGRTYQLRLRTNQRFDGVSYRAMFETRADTWTVIELPFTAFEPTFRGRLLTGVEPLDTASIHQLTFMVADKKPGPFRLEIDSVQAR